MEIRCPFSQLAIEDLRPESSPCFSAHKAVNCFVLHFNRVLRPPQHRRTTNQDLATGRLTLLRAIQRLRKKVAVLDVVNVTLGVVNVTLGHRRGKVTLVRFEWF